MNAVASHGSALAAQGAARAADSVLQAAGGASRGAAARWHERARLLLAIVSGSRVEPRSDLVPNDTTPGAVILRAMWAAASGDSLTARALLGEVDRSMPRLAAPLGDGPVMVEALIAAQGGRPRDVINLLRDRALAGEHDPVMLDRPDSYLTRWLVASAYETVGRTDSATLHYSLVLRPTNLPPTHFALRGIPFGFAHNKLAGLAARAGDRPLAVRHLDTLLAAFRRPDERTAALVDSALASRGSLTATAAVRPRVSRRPEAMLIFALSSTAGKSLSGGVIMRTMLAAGAVAVTALACTSGEEHAQEPLPDAPTVTLNGTTSLGVNDTVMLQGGDSASAIIEVRSGGKRDTLRISRGGSVPLLVISADSEP